MKVFIITFVLLIIVSTVTQSFACNVNGLESCTDRYLDRISGVTSVNQFCKVYGDWLKCFFNSGCFFGFYGSLFDQIANSLNEIGCSINFPTGPCARPALGFGFNTCGEFGDPHLRTIGNNFITCSSSGKSLLYSNEYMDIYWDNVEVASGSNATATRAIEFVSKSCTSGTWQWTNDETWTTGTEIAGTWGTRVFISQTPTRADIYHLETGSHIVVTKAGGFLTFGMRTLLTDDATGACVNGCPGQEININEKRDIIPKNELCDDAGLSGDALTACYFDLSTTQDSGFVENVVGFEEVDEELEDETEQSYIEAVPAPGGGDDGPASQLTPFWLMF